jgi:hypothetical protein
MLGMSVTALPARALFSALINSVLARFNLVNTTPVTTPRAPGMHLSAAGCPTSQDGKDEMGTRPSPEATNFRHLKGYGFLCL